MPGLILSAPSSGSGKTTLSLGLLRALARRGIPVRGAKSGPDYIDPRFHEAASNAPCMNLDAWAMSPARIRSLAASDDLLLIEGAMGLFDGAPPKGKGATADLARILNLPVILVIDAARMAHSVAPIVTGFSNHDPSVQIAGVILNRTGSARHENMLRNALDGNGIPVLGAIPRQTGLGHPSRHLGLVQAQERPDLEHFLNTVADSVAAHVDLDRLIALASRLPAKTDHAGMPPPAQRIAIAQDAAFAFAYPHLIQDWRRAGAEIIPFSPLADDCVPDADLVMLPGGYPELYAGKIAANLKFMQSIIKSSQSIDIYGECGGYMVLGDILIDADNVPHKMAGLLSLQTSFAQRKLHLGYRHLSATSGPFTGDFNGHEFHYATTLKAVGNPLFQATDAEGAALPPMGLRSGRVTGSFAHIIDRA